MYGSATISTAQILEARLFITLICLAEPLVHSVRFQSHKHHTTWRTVNPQAPYTWPNTLHYSIFRYRSWLCSPRGQLPLGSPLDTRWIVCLLNPWILQNDVISTHHERKNQRHNVDRPRGAKAGEDSQKNVILQRWRPLWFSSHSKTVINTPIYRPPRLFIRFLDTGTHDAERAGDSKPVRCDELEPSLEKIRIVNRGSRRNKKPGAEQGMID